jgi:hypothetical protein
MTPREKKKGNCEFEPADKIKSSWQNFGAISISF